MPSTTTIWRRNNPEKFKEQRAKWLASGAKEKQREYQHKLYMATKPQHRASNKASIQRARTYVNGLKSGKACQACGYSDYRALDFHHRDPATKYRTISKLCGDGSSLQRIDKEVVKCDLLCANCHRIHHLENGGY